MKALLAIVFALFSVSATAAPKTITGTAEYKGAAVGGLVKWTGKGAAVSGQLGGDGKAVIWADLTTLKTGDSLRDEHQHNKYLETKKYPKAKLELSGVKDADGEQDLTGSLTIKGDTKPVKVHLKVTGKTYTASLTAKISDYPSIGAPSNGGVLVKDEVEISVTGTTGG